MATAITANRAELIAIADSVAKEKLIDKAIVIDTTAPTLVSVVSTTASGAYKAGDNINVTLTFSEAITTTTMTVKLNTGANVSGSCTGSTCSLTYNVGAGENTTALSATDVIGTGTDSAGNETATWTIPTGQNIADSKTIVIDTAAPTVTSATTTTTSGSYPAGTAIPITLNLSESVTSSTLTATLNAGTTVSLSCSGTTCSGTYTVGSGQNATALNISSLSGTITDAHGQPFAGATTMSVPWMTMVEPSSTAKATW